MTNLIPDSLRIFSARACAAPLEDATKIFSEKTGIEVKIDVCARHCASQEAEEANAEGAAHDFLIEISEDGIHDLCISGAEYLLDDGEIRGIVQKDKRQLIAYRESGIVVKAGNPANIQSVQDLTRDGVRVGISMIDCLKGLWEDVSGQYGLCDEVRENITFYATGCVAIVEAVSQGIVDAAFGWTAFKHLGEGQLETISLPPEKRVYRGTSIAMLSFTQKPDKARQLMDFLATPEARACYEKYNWVLPSTLQEP